MTFARICQQTVADVHRQNLFQLWPQRGTEATGFSQTSAKGILTRVSTSVSRTLSFRSLFCLSAATTTSLVTLLVLSSSNQASTPLHTSHRDHSHSESDSHREDTKTLQEKAELAVMQKPQLSDKLKAAKVEAVYGMLVADAIAMPVHWYYNPDDIKRGYGNWITGYTAPNRKHPSSILSLSAVDGSGRGSGASVPLIGNVILHDKLQFWKGNSVHYHQGMSAGDNTLNSVTAVEMLKSMNRIDPGLVKSDREVRAAVLEDYVKFMTTPGTHNDTYAESFHRSFFKDWVQENPHPKDAETLIEFAEQRSREKLSESADSQLAVIGSIVLAIPWIIRSAHRTEQECAKSAVDFIRLTHPVASLVPFVDTYAKLLHAILNGHDLRAETLKVLGNSDLGGPDKRQRVLQFQDEAQKYPKGSEERLRVYQSATSQLGSACYIAGAMSSMLFLALEFHDDVMGGILANANCGGENCHRGSALGALLGAAAANQKKTIPAVLKDNLHSMKSAAASVVRDMNQI